eukprot:3934740-Rhodomonas_salina.1
MQRNSRGHTALHLVRMLQIHSQARMRLSVTHVHATEADLSGAEVVNRTKESGLLLRRRGRREHTVC